MLHIINHQLLGDSLMATPALKKLTELGVEYTVYFLDEGIMNIYKEVWWMKNKVWGKMPEPAEGDRVIKLESGIALNYSMSNGGHYAFGFAHQLGVTIDSPKPDVDFENWPKMEGGEIFEKPFLCIFPESSSCSSGSGMKANKMLPWATWKQFYEQEKENYEIRFIVPKSPPIYDLPFISDMDIRSVALLLKKASKVLTVDNGIGHLSTAVGANCYMIGGCVPIPWIWAGQMNKTFNCKGNPETVTVDDIVTLINR